MNRAHGRHETYAIGQVLLTYFAGDFNIQAARARTVDMKRLAPTGAPWAMLNHSVQWETAGADTLAELQAQRAWMFEHGCVCIATVLPDRFHAQLLQRNAGQFPGKQIEYFYDLDKACAWLSAQGFAIQPSDLPPPSWARSEE